MLRPEAAGVCEVMPEVCCHCFHWLEGPRAPGPGVDCGQTVGAAGGFVCRRDVAGCAFWLRAYLTRAPASVQFTAKQLEKLAKKAEKDSKAEQAKVKKVRSSVGSILQGLARPTGSARGLPEQDPAPPVLASDWPRSVPFLCSDPARFTNCDCVGSSVPMPLPDPVTLSSVFPVKLEAPGPRARAGSLQGGVCCSPWQVLDLVTSHELWHPGQKGSRTAQHGSESRLQP